MRCPHGNSILLRKLSEKNMLSLPVVLHAYEDVFRILRLKGDAKRESIEVTRMLGIETRELEDRLLYTDFEGAVERPQCPKQYSTRDELLTIANCLADQSKTQAARTLMAFQCVG